MAWLGQYRWRGDSIATKRKKENKNKTESQQGNYPKQTISKSAQRKQQAGRKEVSSCESLEILLQEVLRN